MNTTALLAKSEYYSNVDGALAATATDPRAPNCRGFQTDASNQVVGIELVHVPIPSARYELYRAEMIDPYASGGNTVVRVVALDKNGVETGEQLVKAWPFPTLDAGDSPCGSGNPSNEFEITSKFDKSVVGPLAFHIIDAGGSIISDVVGGYGQVMGYGHISGRVTFKERSGIVVPDPDPEPVPDGEALTRIAVALERLTAHLGA
jgi:hypothetical protein